MATINRRDFVKGTLGAGLLVSAGSFLAACSPQDKAAPSSSGPAAETKASSFKTPPAAIPESEITQMIDTEVVVIGGGASGFFAANSALEHGAKVALISDTPEPGGRGSEFFGINSKATKAAGLPDIDIETVFKRRIGENQARVSQDLWYRAAEKNPEAIDWLIDKMEAAGYATSLVEPAYDRFTNEPIVYPGTLAWMGEDPEVATGKLVVNVLNQAAAAAGCEFHFNTKAEQLVREDPSGPVDAVIAKGPDGYIRFNASKGIILATGDFTGDKEMMAVYCPDFAEFPSGGLYEGTGHKMALWAGAAWQDFAPNAPMVDFITGGIASYDSHRSFSGLLVNKNGVRYANEDMITPFAAAATVKQPDYLAVALWDASYAQKAAPWKESWLRPSDPAELVAAWDTAAAENQPIGFGAPEQTTVKADTLDELAEKIGIPADTLKKTVERYNAAAAAGKDDEFFKHPELMIPLADPPFYAQYGTPWQLVCTGGIKANAKMQAIDTNGDPIPQLYVAGTMVGGMYDVYDYKFAGMNLGVNCCTFGYIAGEEAASNS